MTDSECNRKTDVLLTRRFRARAGELGETRSAVRNCLTQSHCCFDTVEEVVLAVDEACQNIIRHAYGGETDEEIVLQIDRDGDALVLSLRDYAPEVGPDCMKPRDLDELRPGGLGCHFIQQVMDEVSVGRPSEGQGNVLRMVKRIS